MSLDGVELAGIESRVLGQDLNRNGDAADIVEQRGLVEQRQLVLPQSAGFPELHRPVRHFFGNPAAAVVAVLD